MLGQSGLGSDGNEGVLRIPKSSSITGASPSNWLMLYPGYLFGRRSYSSAEMQSMYSTAPSDWAMQWKGLEPNHQMQFSVKSRLLIGEGLTTLQRCSWCIVQPPLTQHVCMCVCVCVCTCVLNRFKYTYTHTHTQTHKYTKLNC